MEGANSCKSGSSCALLSKKFEALHGIVNGVRQVVEHVASVVCEQVQGGNNGNGDQRCNQRVFNCRCAAFLLEEAWDDGGDFGHRRFRFSAVLSFIKQFQKQSVVADAGGEQ